MTKTKLKATSLKNTMLSSIVIITILSAVGFYFAQDYFTQQFITKNTTAPTTNVAMDFAQIKKEIGENKINIENIDKFFISGEDYQNTINSNLDKYAGLTELSINSKEWIVQNESGGSKSVTIAIKNPVAIDRLIKFIKAIENSLPKMSLSNLSIKPVSNQTH